jgi:hypothetical protein
MNRLRHSFLCLVSEHGRRRGDASRQVPGDKPCTDSDIRFFLRGKNLRDPIKNFQGTALGRPQTQSSGDGVDVTVHTGRSALSR